MKYQKIDKTLKDIQEFKYQGATAVAEATLTAYRDYGRTLKLRRPDNWRAEMKAVLTYLMKHNRPNEPLAHNGLRFVWHRINACPNALTLRAAVDEYLRLADTAQQGIATLGRSIIKKHDHILTHCHSSSVERLLIETFRQKKFKIFSTETRPRFQGRTTARRLLQSHIPVTEIVDSAAPFFISRASGDAWHIDRVIIGADVVLPDGSVVNKIGSYGISLAAYTDDVPVYIAATLLKYAQSKHVQIEQRSPDEVWPRDAKGLQIINPAFDIVPARMITGIVCEFGIIKPAMVWATAQRHYPWLWQR